MEKPSWAPLVLSGALPREFPDLLAMLIIAITSFESSVARQTVGNFQLGSLIPFLAIPPACALASLSNTGKKVREELALFAYGGSGWEVLARYFLRGLACSLLALSPLILFQTVSAGLASILSNPIFLLASVIGGLCYAAPSQRRLRSEKLAGNYKA